MKGRLLQALIWIVVCSFLSALPVSASEAKDYLQSDTGEKLYREIHMEDLEEAMDSLFPDHHLDLLECMHLVGQGRLADCAKLLKEALVAQLSGEVKTQKDFLIRILTLIILSALLTHFAGAFGSEQIAQVSFYAVYLLLMLLCFREFQWMLTRMTNAFHQWTYFFGALCPVYFLAVAIATGVNSAVLFYQVILFLLYLFQLVIVGAVCPFLQVFLLIRLLGDLSLGRELEKLAGVMKLIVDWILKGMMAFVCGMSVLQGLIAPVMDQVKRSIALRTIESVPMVGDAANGITEVALGTAVLLKNSVGVFGMLVCVAFFLFPILKSAVMALLFQLLSGATGPIADPRIGHCLTGMTEVYGLLMKTALVSGMLFFISMAVITATTTG